MKPFSSRRDAIARANALTRETEYQHTAKKAPEGWLVFAVYGREWIGADGSRAHYLKSEIMERFGSEDTMERHESSYSISAYADPHMLPDGVTLPRDGYDPRKAADATKHDDGLRLSRDLHEAMTYKHTDKLRGLPRAHHDGPPQLFFGGRMKKAVCVFIQNTEGQILAVARPNTTDQWGLPGGKVDPGEDLLTAAIRELEEETGIKADFNDLEYVFEADCLGEVDYNTVTFKFVSPTPSGEFKGDAGPVAWVTEDDLFNGPFGKYNIELMQSIQRQQV